MARPRRVKDDTENTSQASKDSESRDNHSVQSRRNYTETDTNTIQVEATSSEAEIDVGPPRPINDSEHKESTTQAKAKIEEVVFDKIVIKQLPRPRCPVCSENRFYTEAQRNTGIKCTNCRRGVILV